VEGLAGECEVRFAECFILGGMSVDENCHIVGMGFPVHDELGLADLLAYT
jgi:hypothetical protein